MSLVYCSQNHANAPENRFCAACGERLTQGRISGGESGRESGAIQNRLAGRYQIQRALGQDSFGRTYLAEDLHRFHELCVLKEFAPQVQGTEALQKAEALFEREAGILYQLQHPQIPRFRELFRATLKDQERLFLVQDYVEGSTYRELLEARILDAAIQPPYFSESEIRLLLEQILPVLRYIHGAGVIHRDLSPDNLILRTSDRLPVLIDFGGVKQIAAAATSRYKHSAETRLETGAETGAETLLPTRLGKQGYAPPEQMQQGRVSPQGDLYALAVTALVLITGKRSLDLVDPAGERYPWQQEVLLSPGLTDILTRMLKPQPSARFPSADDVLLALQLAPVSPSISQSASPLVQPAATRAVPAYNPPVYPAAVSAGSTQEYTQQHTQALPSDSGDPASPPPAQRRFLLLLLLPLLLLPAAAYFWRESWLPLLPVISTAESADPDLASPSPAVEPSLSPSPSPLSPLERRAQAAEVSYEFLIQLTDASFAQRYPKQAGRSLSDSPEDAKWRQKWADLADEWLSQLTEVLSPEARQKLGRYGEADRSSWKPTINQHYVGSRSLYDLSDAQFLQHFPDWRKNLEAKDFLAQPMGQIWQAIATDQIQALEAGTNLENIEFAAGAFSQKREDTLAAGKGRVYTANLAAAQILRLNLQAPSQSSLLSIYLPRPTPELPVLLEDSAKVTWVGKLPQSGYYEVVVVNRASQPIRYQLTLAVDNVTSPDKPDQTEAPEAKD